MQLVAPRLCTVCLHLPTLGASPTLACSSNPPQRQVLLRKLDPKTRLPPRGDAHVSIWQPKALTLPAHRLGLVALAAGRRLVITAGASGSVKLTPEGALRVLAAEGGVRLPASASAVAEALTALLFGGQGSQSAAAATAAAVAVLKTAGSAASSASTAAAVGGLLSQYGSMHGAASAGQLQAALLGLDAEQLARVQAAGGAAGFKTAAAPFAFAQQAEQQQQQQGSSGPGTPAAPSAYGGSGRGPPPLGVGGGPSTDGGGSSAPPSELQSARNSGASRRGASGDGGGAAAAPAAAPDAAAAAAAGSGGPGGGQAAPGGRVSAGGERALQRAPSSSWPQQQQLALDSPWVLRYEDLRLGRVVGEGAFGYVRLGVWRETEVAVKVLNAPGAAVASRDDPGGDDGAAWDEKLLRALSKEARGLGGKGTCGAGSACLSWLPAHKVPAHSAPLPPPTRPLPAGRHPRQSAPPQRGAVPGRLPQAALRRHRVLRHGCVQGGTPASWGVAAAGVACLRTPLRSVGLSALSRSPPHPACPLPPPNKQAPCLTCCARRAASPRLRRASRGRAAC
jgi:hypothetical protein